MSNDQNGVCGIGFPPAGSPDATGIAGNHDVTAADATASASAEEGLRRKAWDIRFRVGISRRYNIRLSGYYSALDNLTSVVGLLGGSTAFADVLGAGQTGLALYSSLLVAAMAALSLAFRWSDKAKAHMDVYRQYTRLQERLDRAGDPPADAEIRAIKADFTAIEAGEPALKTALMVVCHNEQATAEGLDPSHKVRLECWQRWAAYQTTLPPYNWEK